jgi:hypothetical protein
MPKDDSANKDDEDKNLFSWRRKESESDAPVAPKTSTMIEPKLRVSNLLSKAAAEDDDSADSTTVEGEDYVTDPEGYRNPTKRSLKDSMRSWQNFWKSPIMPSLAFGTIPAVGYYAFSKFSSPDDPEDQEIRKLADDLVKQDIEAGVPLKDADHYINAAINKQQRQRLARALAIGVGSATLAHTPNINPSDWSMLYKYRPVPEDDKNTGVKHTASMFGLQDPYRTADELRTAIIFNDKMTPEMKADAIRVIDYAPKPLMSSTDVVNNAIHSGISGVSGLPMGRIISSAAVDGAIGYGLGNILGANRPGRVAGLFAAGSALANALKYADKNY